MHLPETQHQRLGVNQKLGAGAKRKVWKTLVQCLADLSDPLVQLSFEVHHPFSLDVGFQK